MRNIIRISIVILIIISESSCRIKNEASYGDLGIVTPLDSLFITVEFSDCGEWGGHSDKIILKRDYNETITARIQIDSIPCGNIITKEDSYGTYGDLDDNDRIIVHDTTITLSKKEEGLFRQFLNRVFDLYLENNHFPDWEPGDDIVIYKCAGQRITISNRYLNLEYWNPDMAFDTDYCMIRREIINKIIKDN